jgi:hypothetical protein
MVIRMVASRVCKVKAEGAADELQARRH